mgnify:CR=1 FL=1
MNNRIRRSALLLAPLVLLAGPVRAADSGSDSGSSVGSGILQSLGEFVLNGLGPPRTMEDILRDERAAAARAGKEVEAVRPEAGKLATLPSPVPAADPLSADVSVPPPATKPGKVNLAKIEAATMDAGRIDPPKPEPKSVAEIIPPPPRPRPVSAIRGATAPALPSEPLKSPIAATATVDQAMRLGGRSDLYRRTLMAD